MPEKIAAAAAGSFAGHFVLPLRLCPVGHDAHHGWAGLSPWGQGSCALPLPMETYQFPNQHQVFTTEGEGFAIILPVNLGSILLFFRKPIKFC